MSAGLVASPEVREKLRRKLTELGFDDVRFATVSSPGSNSLRSWLDAGMQADMAWMERTAEKRLKPELVLPGVKSIVLLGVSYWAGAAQRPRTSGITNPVWARYALHADYHDTIKPALIESGRAIEELCGARASDYRYYVDTGPVLERSWAARAGLGFIGKNAMLISRRHGNWLLLAAILTRVELAPDAPIRKRVALRTSKAHADIGLLCGKCTRCLDACPTQAFPHPGVVDARRCISYQTIENKGSIPRELRPGIGTRIYGCDVCLEVCPWNRFARASRRMLLAARDDIAALPLREILELTPARFAAVFGRTAIKRVKLPGLLRNACVAAGNSGDASLLAPLVRLAAHESPLVRAHAVWGVRQLGGMPLLATSRAVEKDPTVLEEYTAHNQDAPP